MPDYGLHFQWSPGIYIQDIGTNNTNKEQTDDQINDEYETSNSDKSNDSNTNDEDNRSNCSGNKPEDDEQQELSNIIENESENSEEHKDKSNKDEEQYEEEDEVSGNEYDPIMDTEINAANDNTTMAHLARRYSLRNNRGPTFKTKFANAIDNPQSTKSYDSQFFSTQMERINC